MCWQRILALAYLLASLAPTGIADAQSVVTIGSDVACPRCRLTIARAATIGRDDDPVAWAPYFDVTRDSRGRYIVAPSDNGSQFLIYGRDGRFVRAVGRAGQGPGEFRSLFRVIVGAGDTLHAFDAGTRRWSVFSPTLEHVRSIPLPFTAQAAVFLRPDQLVVHDLLPTRERSGLPLHLVSARGDVGPSFGNRAAAMSAGRRAELFRVVTRASDSSVWAGYFDRYRIERWHVSGRLEHVVERSASWYPQWSEYGSYRLDERRPQAQMRFIWQTPNGLLFVVTRVPDTRWQPSDESRTRAPRQERPILPRTENARYTDTIIEVLDPRRGTLVTLLRIPEAIDGFLPDGSLYSVRELPSGAEAIDVWRVQLTTP